MDVSGAPASFEELRAAILARRAELPKRLMQVAAFALDHPDEIALRTAASIAEAAEVQPSTLVRFAQLFGFEGFSSLQALFRARLRERNANYDERLKALHEGVPAGGYGILTGFVAAGHRSLETLTHAVSPAAFERAVAILAGAETIFLIARRRSYPITSYMAYGLGKLRIKCITVGTAAGIDEDMLALAGPRDAAFAVSFSSYAQETATLTRAIAERGAKVVSLTDSAFSPLAECSDVWFELVEADHAGFRSLSASMALAMALTVAVAEKRREVE